MRTPRGVVRDLGRLRQESGSGVRSFPFKSYVIFFRYVGDEMQVVHIVSSRRDPGSVLNPIEGD